MTPVPAPSVRLRIERLALNGFALDARQQRTVRRAAEAELGTLLAGDRLPARLLAGGAVPRIRGGELRIGAWTDPAHLGRQVAQAVYAGFQR